MEKRKPKLLSELKPGDSATILGYTLDNRIARRMTEMGLVPGRDITYIRYAPFKDPLQIRVGSSDLAIRGTEASLVRVIYHSQ